MDKEQILYEDKDMIVCYKPALLATQTARIGQSDMVSEVANYLAASGHMRTPPYVGILHRLDQPVEGVLVFAKNQKAVQILSSQIAKNQTEKYYYAVVVDARKEIDAAQEGTLTDYLYKDGKSNLSTIVSQDQEGAKRADLHYAIQKRMSVDGFPLALVKIRLLTGRHHQIRAQMSHAGMGLLGDYKYADGQGKEISKRLQQKQIALCAYKIGLKHPATNEWMWFQKMPQGQIFQKFFP
ncbi:MAG: RluA family pseudouridine synthase [Blautia sp.]|nr:RluA family pseudouridine synthase [Lachnoclostridium sp.]MCM1212746.1 RluA family pseudouridine synthase [Blautia sp.]